MFSIYGSSLVACTRLCAPRICSARVLPERGIPTINTGAAHPGGVCPGNPVQGLQGGCKLPPGITRKRPLLCDLLIAFAQCRKRHFVRALLFQCTAERKQQQETLRVRPGRLREFLHPGGFGRRETIAFQVSQAPTGRVHHAGLVRIEQAVITLDRGFHVAGRAVGMPEVQGQVGVAGGGRQAGFENRDGFRDPAPVEQGLAFTQAVLQAVRHGSPAFRTVSTVQSRKPSATWAVTPSPADTWATRLTTSALSAAVSTE